MNAKIALTAVVLCLLAVLVPGLAELGADPGQHGVPGPSPGPVVNKVIDLLDSDVILDTESGENLWESDVFDTSQFTRLVLQMSGEVTEGGLSCSTSWQFLPEDVFLSGTPFAFIGSTSGRVLGPSQIDSPEVRGLQARVTCNAVESIARLCDDRPAPCVLKGSGTLADVKVLLRRF